MGEQHATHNAKEPAAHDSETSSSRAVKVPGDSFPHPLFQLREKLGNRSFGQLIQAKLTVSQPNDPYEQEADRVADEVMRMAEPTPSRPAEEEEDEQEKGVQAKPLYPQITPLVQRQAEEDQEEEVQAKFLPLTQSMIQRQELGQDEEEEKKKLHRQPISQEEEEEESELQRQPIPQITPDLEARIRALKGSGRPLSESERKFFEPRFGVDFPEVRIHKNTAADELSHTLSANAFTTGKDIFFRQRAYDAESSQGKELLAHELTHVVQQGGAVQGKAAAIQPYDVSTGEAGRAVDKAEGRHSSKEMLSGKRPSVPEAPDGQRLFVYPLTRGSEPVNTSLVLNSSPTDVVIQTKPDTEVTGAIGLETWHKEINKWTFKAQGLLKESPLEAAYNFRVGLLLLQTSTPEQFRNQEEFNEFTDKCGEIALSESETLRAIGEFAQGFLILHSEAFPDTWADKLKNILPVCELDDVIKEVEYSSKEVEQIAESTPSYLFEHGLPVSYSEALMLEHFELAFLHAKLPFEHIVKEFVKAGIHWMIKEELFAFGNAWNVISRQLIEQVRKGKVAVNIELFNSIIKFSDDAKTWVKNLANVQDIDELNQLEEQANIFTDPIMSGIGMPSLLIGLGMGLRTWESVQASFAKRLLETDALIAEEGASSLPQLLQKIASLPMAPLAAIDILSMPRVQRIFRWAQEGNYIPSFDEIIKGLLDNAGEILGYFVLGLIPVVGEIIGVIFGVQVIVLILDFFDALTKAVSAKSTVELQRETARLVKISVDLAVTLGILAAFSSGKFVWRRAKKLMEENPHLSKEAAIKQATAEARAQLPEEKTTRPEEAGLEGTSKRLEIESQQAYSKRLTQEVHPEWWERKVPKTPLPEKTRIETPLKSLGTPKRPVKGYYTGKKPPLEPPSGEQRITSKIPQVAGLEQEKLFSAITGWPKNTKSHYTSFGNRKPDYLVTKDPKTGEWITATKPEDASFVADSKYYNETTISLRGKLGEQLKGFIEIASKTNPPSGHKFLLLMTNPTAKIDPEVMEWAADNNVTVMQIRQTKSL